MRVLGFSFNFKRLFPAATTVYCEICMEHVPSASSFKTTAQCKHSFRRSCLSSYITMRANDRVAKMPCPSLQCQAMLDPLHCEELFSSKSYLTWCDLLCERYALGLERCYCPNLNCHEVILNECGWKGNVKRFECSRCHQSGCFRCAEVWTEGHQCRSTQEVDLSLFEHLVNAKNLMRCPNCHMYVECDGGCSYIFCRFNFGRPKLFRAAPTVYCEICMERIPSTSSFKTTARCKHSFCSRCLSSYIALRIGDGVADVQCPGSNCRARLDPLRCKELISSKSFLTWCDLLCESQLVGFSKHYCPNLNCRELIVDECGRSGNVKRFECPSCRRSGCFRCASAWVEGHRCGITNDEDLILLERLADMNKWVRCPNCRTYVERNGGCIRIHCRCGTWFCHACGKNQCRFRCPLL